MHDPFLAGCGCLVLALIAAIVLGKAAAQGDNIMRGLGGG